MRLTHAVSELSKFDSIRIPSIVTSQRTATLAANYIRVLILGMPVPFAYRRQRWSHMSLLSIPLVTLLLCFDGHTAWPHHTAQLRHTAWPRHVVWPRHTVWHRCHGSGLDCTLHAAALLIASFSSWHICTLVPHICLCSGNTSHATIALVVMSHDFTILHGLEFRGFPEQHVVYDTVARCIPINLIMRYHLALVALGLTISFISSRC